MSRARPRAATGAWLAALLVAGCRASPLPARAHDAGAPASPVSEVAVDGRLARPDGGAGPVTVWIADAPCWQPGTRAFAVTRSDGDRFAATAFVPAGASVWVCAARTAGAAPLAVYGQAARVPRLGRGVGALALHDVVVPLRPGPPVTPPPLRVAPPR